MSGTPAGPDAAGLRRALRSRLAVIGGPLQILAEHVLGEEDVAIDWVAVEPNGRVWVVLLDSSGSDERLLVRGLAQRAWVRARLADWRQLSRELPVRRDVSPLLVLLAPDFSRFVRIAAREVDRDGVRLGRYRWQPGPRGSTELVLEPVGPLASPVDALIDSPVEGESKPPAPDSFPSTFKSGLTDRDFEAPRREAGSPCAPEGSDNSRPADDNS